MGLESFLLLGLAGLCAVSSPVILDTDLGDDIDDTWALAALLGMPECPLKMVVTAFDNTPKKAALVGKVLEGMGHAEIPIGIGAKTSDKNTNQDAWLSDYSLERYPGKVHQDGVQAMIDFIKSSPLPVTLCVIGPQTNLKAALQRAPEIAKNARVVSMAGSVRVGYEGADKPAPEWNVVADAAAAQAVFAAPWEIIYAPLDSCGLIKLKGAPYRELATSRAVRARTIIGNYDLWTNRVHYPADSSSTLFDTLAVYLLGEDKLCTMETLSLRIDEKGNTLIDLEKGRPVRCATKLNDPVGFERWLIKAILSGSPDELSTHEKKK